MLRSLSYLINCLILILTINIIGNRVLAQGLNYPVGNPTANSGTGNARTDSANFFMRNNIAGLTEIPLNDEEEQSLKPAKAARGSWRFNGEVQFLSYQQKHFLPPSNRFLILDRKGRSFIPALAGEITYTTANHRFGFGIGTYQIVNYHNRFNDINPDNKNNPTFFEDNINSTDIAIGGAVRLHKKLSVGMAFIFGRANLMAANKFQYLDKQEYVDADAIGAPGLSVAVHYRPTDYLSFGVNYKNRRKYQLKGEAKNFLGRFGVDFFGRIHQVNIISDFELPTIAEAGLQLKVSKRLLLATDFRFYDYTATLQTFDIDSRDPRVELFRSFSIPDLRGIFGLDIHAFNIGAKYSLNDRTIVNAGVTVTSNGFTDSNQSSLTLDNGNTIAGGISRRIRNQWITASFVALPGRNRPRFPTSREFSDRYRGNGFLISLGWRSRL